MSKFVLSERSIHNIEGCHEHIHILCREAIKITPYQFAVPDGGGLRSITYQRGRYAMGRTSAGPLCRCGGKINQIGTCQKHPLGMCVTWTMNSPHLLGHAVDFIVLIDGKYVDGDTPDELKYYNAVADSFLVAGAKHNIPTIWGGTFRDKNGKPRPDSGHIQLNENFYKGK